ncbi:MAG: thiamine pyrophosphate-binding protein, partial [Elusimicrobiaceae bacterium]|nr:thiamine pyrophosphate-binding protein [Elusimicrobiaceae bacterium]
MKLSDYAAEKIAGLGIRDVFTVTGGGAMHLNMSLGLCPQLRCVYNHHEQASAIAAEGYARLTNKMPLVCVTTGPGGINALTGVFGAWTDSIPMFVLSGQVKYSTTVRSSGLSLRQLGDQEFDIAKAVSGMTKYAVMITDPYETGYHIERAFRLAAHGRPGPVWLDIPMNVQGADIDPARMRKYDPAEDAEREPPPIPAAAVAEIIEKIRSAKRPVMLVGTGVRLSGAHEEFLKAVEALNIPVATAWNAHDALEETHPLYCGRPGTVGGRAGNFAVQNSDLLLNIGCRMNVRQVSYNWENFARVAYKISIDIDPAELEKPTVRPDMPVCGDCADFFRQVMKMPPLEPKADWLGWCKERLRRYPAVTDEMRRETGQVNPYVFMDRLSDALDENAVTVCSNGSAVVMTFQALRIKKGQRLFSNSGCASMGYGLPAAIGAAVASGGPVVCMEGDGSLQMNIQEFQTLVKNGLPVHVFVINNAGYHSIRQTQRNFMGGRLAGCDCESGVDFPDLEKISAAYGLPFFRIRENSELARQISAALAYKGPCVCEIMADPKQDFEPK